LVAYADRRVVVSHCHDPYGLDCCLASIHAKDAVVGRLTGH
jgi:hypothetical protein